MTRSRRGVAAGTARTRGVRVRGRRIHGRREARCALGAECTRYLTPPEGSNRTNVSKKPRATNQPQG
jgi:hypothetical protein